MDTNLVQSLINILECQLEEAFEAVRGGGAGGAAGGKRPSVSKKNAPPDGEDGGVLDPKVRPP